MHLDRQNEASSIDLPRLSTVEELLLDLAAGGTGVSELPLGQRWLLVSPQPQLVVACVSTELLSERLLVVTEPACLRS